MYPRRRSHACTAIKSTLRRMVTNGGRKYMAWKTWTTSMSTSLYLYGTRRVVSRSASMVGLIEVWMPTISRQR